MASQETKKGEEGDTKTNPTIAVYHNNVFLPHLVVPVQSSELKAILEGMRTYAHAEDAALVCCFIGARN